MIKMKIHWDSEDLLLMHDPGLLEPVSYLTMRDSAMGVVTVDFGKNNLGHQTEVSLELIWFSFNFCHDFEDLLSIKKCSFATNLESRQAYRSELSWLAIILSTLIMGMMIL